MSGPIAELPHRDADPGLPQQHALAIPKYSEVPVSIDLLSAAKDRLLSPPDAEVKVTEIMGVPGAHVTITAMHDRTMGRWNKVDKGQGQSLGGFRIRALSDMFGSNIHEKMESAKKLTQMLGRDMTFKWIMLHRMLADMQARGEDVKDYEVKAALMGGAKSVALFDDGAYPNLSDDDMKSFLHQHGDHIQQLGGKTNTAPDMGTDSAKMDLIKERTKWVNSCKSDFENPIEADPSPTTADGVWYSADALIQEMQIENPSFAVQGVGKVGKDIVKHIFNNHPEATVYVAEKLDDNFKRVLEENSNKVAQIVRLDPDTQDIYQKADVFMPCAGAEILTEETTNWIIAPESNTKLIAGSANDQYSTDEHGAPIKALVDKLHNAGKVAATAWVINGGGIANVSTEFHKHLGGPKPSATRARELIRGVGPLVRDMYRRVKETGKSFEEIAEQVVFETYAAFCVANEIDMASPLPTPL